MDPFFVCYRRRLSYAGSLDDAVCVAPHVGRKSALAQSQTYGMQDVQASVLTGEPVIVVAAGGIADGRGLAAALAYSFILCWLSCSALLRQTLGTVLRGSGSGRDLSQV